MQFFAALLREQRRICLKQRMELDSWYDKYHPRLCLHSPHSHRLTRNLHIGGCGDTALGFISVILSSVNICDLASVFRTLLTFRLSDFPIVNMLRISANLKPVFTVNFTV